MSMELPNTEEPTVYMEQITAAYRNFRLGGMTRIEYLDEISRITRERDTIGSERNGHRVRVDSVIVDNQFRQHKWNEYTGLGSMTDSVGNTVIQAWGTGRQPGLSLRELAGSMDAEDSAKREATADA